MSADEIAALIAEKLPKSKFEDVTISDTAPNELLITDKDGTLFVVNVWPAAVQPREQQPEG